MSSTLAATLIVQRLPNVQMIACISMPHPKWDERPFVVVVKRPGSNVRHEEVLQSTKAWQRDAAVQVH
ncbi:hypothetical protein LJR290_003202 [Variovorax sp. LjRoot290]|uniref:hypothetical protein n=1 Tax=Variovorax sp. LjRoot290 TaxID=3342316 RepID=UPI003ED0FD9D